MVAKVHTAFSWPEAGGRADHAGRGHDAERTSLPGRADPAGEAVPGTTSETVPGPTPAGPAAATGPTKGLESVQKHAEEAAAALERLTELVIRFAAAASSAAAGVDEAEEPVLRVPGQKAEPRGRAVGHARQADREFPWPGWPRSPRSRPDADGRAWRPVFSRIAVSA